MTKSAQKRAISALRALAVVGCVALFVLALSRTDLAGGWQRIRALGPVALVVLIPFPVALASDAAAWGTLLRATGARAPLTQLFKVRLATEAVASTAPAGLVWAEAVAPVLLARRAGVELANVVAASAAKRWLVVRTHGGFVALATALGATAMVAASRRLIGSDALIAVGGGGALGLVLISLGIEQAAVHAHFAGRLSRLLGRFKGLERWIAAREHQFTDADAKIQQIARDKPASVRAAGLLLFLWLVESLETFLILRLLGAHIGLVEVMSFDALLTVVRSAAVFAPAGIGVQDLGYLAVLQAYGVPDALAIGPAFVVMKRMKEAVWIAVGFIVLARTGGRRVFQRAALAPVQPPSAAT